VRLRDELISRQCLNLGFHTLGLYIHNDVVTAFSNQDAAILLEPVFALSFIRVSAVISQGLGTGDLLVHHAIALGLHLTTLILVKGSLDAKSSRLFPDKHNYMISFA
jgi:photosystem I P700 chlorophyll a apoprotein A2